MARDKADGLQAHHTPEYVASRPRLRGISHLVMAPVAAVMAVALVWNASGVGRITTGVFGVLLVGLYSISGSYHVPAWTGRVRMLWGRVDTAMIVLFIAGTFTPIAWSALDGQWRFWSLIIAWLVALVGAGLAISPVTAPRWLRTFGYVAIGWLMVVPMFKIAASLPLAGTLLIVLGGVLYTLGGVVYARERPNPAPEWFGYHEIFHLFVVAASVCHYVAILRYVA
ncbi:PAQR family membrane homeostasis protein TrhA [Euzebya tangerina]|uniref:PAQR family membrane homeostasis protein TrhA n=1 Tax=Euzebya tangerina TaxID=591198 RepID=UPI000E3184BF|nr:hemolysin III family protein [Euzebya tangerina]